MLSRAPFYRSRHPPVVHVSTALRRACSILHQVYLLHHRPDSRSRQEQQPPDDTVGETSDQRLAALRSIGECITDDELTLLLKKKPIPVCYAWCDPTPWMHITQGITMTINVNKLIRAGCKVKILMADSFARTDPHIAREMTRGGGDPGQLLRDICSYNVETWRAAGMDLGGVEIVRLSDEISGNADDDAYWPLAMDVARVSGVGTMQRWLRVHASQDPRRGYEPIDPYSRRGFTAADMLHPCLQCAAMLLFQKEVDVWLLGLDQREAYELSRQYRKIVMAREKSYNRPPIALFHNELPNLLEHPWAESFDPRWAIFMEDDEEGLDRKIRYSAFCPPASAQGGNPCLEYVKCIVLPWLGKFEVVRKEKDGGSKTFLSMEEVTADYESGALRPADVRQGLVVAIDMMLRPVRDQFTSSSRGKEIAKAMRRFYVVGWSP